jgi:enoyl-CoA hydratase/carnithine racemase
MITTIGHDSVRELRLNRPPVNALSLELIVGLHEEIEKAARDGIRALIVSGVPGRFSAGLDVPLLLGLEPPAMADLWRELYALLQAIAASPIPIAAAVTGHAPAGGTVLALFCDWRVMAQGEYKLGLNEVQVGIPLPPVIVAALKRLVGARHAERLAVSGALLSPQEALDIGLVDEVASVEQVVPRAQEWCLRMLALPSEAMTITRREARSDLSSLFGIGLEEELEAVIANWWRPSTQSTLHALLERLKKKTS